MPDDILTLGVDGGAAPDGQELGAALENLTTAAAPPPDESAAPSAAPSDPSVTGEKRRGRPEAARWSRSTAQKKPKPVLVRRLLELQDENERLQAAAAPAGDSDGQAQGARLAEQEAEAKGHLTLALTLSSALMATARGEHWKLSPEEVEALSSAWAPIYAPYVHLTGRYIPWAGALLTSYQVLAPRVARERELAKLREAESLASVTVPRADDARASGE
jgi:hypothetical protein